MSILFNNYKGFYNLGNTCYLNSGLQLIINNKELCNYILLLSKNNPNMLSQFITDYYNNHSNITLNPGFIKEIVANNNNEFTIIDEEIQDIINESYVKAKQCLTKHKQQIINGANLLKQMKTMNYSDLYELMNVNNFKKNYVI